MKLCQLSGLVMPIQCLSSAFLILVFAGCGDSFLFNDQSLPAPLRYDFPYELNGQSQEILGGDNFQLEENGNLHYIVIEGVDAPKPDEPYFEKAMEKLTDLINFKMLRLRVVGRDSHQREIAFVYLPQQRSTEVQSDAELDVGLEMIRHGFGWYDGNQFEAADQYKGVEEQARAEGRGIWANGNEQNDR